MINSHKRLALAKLLSQSSNSLPYVAHPSFFELESFNDLRLASNDYLRGVSLLPSANFIALIHIRAVEESAALWHSVHSLLLSLMP